MPGLDFAHVHDDVNIYVLRMFDGNILLDAVEIVNNCFSSIISRTSIKWPRKS